MIPSRMEYAQKIRPVAVAVEREFGIKADLGVVQSAHESNFGRSKLAVAANNLFGFTGDSWKKAGKPVYEIDTREFLDGKWVTVKRPFRLYQSWEESYRDWARLISTASRYRKAYAAAKEGNLSKFASELQKGGYATDPTYANKLVALAASHPELSLV